MKIRNWLFIAPLLLGVNFSQAQEKKLLTIKDAVTMALSNSNAIALANAKVTSAEQELKVSKNNQLPSFKLSGQYLRLSKVDVSTSIGSGNPDGSGVTAQKTPAPEQLILGQANVGLPLFNGGIIRNNIKANNSKYEAENSSAKHTKEQLAVRVIELFANLYRAEQSMKIIAGNLKTSEQRVKDFTAMEANGLIARNDLLKAQLQVSRMKLALEENKKNESVANYELATLLKLPEGTEIGIDVESIRADLSTEMGKSNEGTRYDLQSAMLQQSAAETGVKIAKGNYWPSVSLIGGYLGVNVQDVLTVKYAMNIGVGVSYDVASLWKNNAHVKLATSRSNEAKQHVAMLNDQIKEEAHRSQENYDLAVKQSKVYDEAVLQATENYRIVKDKHDNSLATTNDLIEADTDQLLVKINQALSKADIAQKYYELQFAQGKLVNSLNISSN